MCDEGKKAPTVSTTFREVLRSSQLVGFIAGNKCLVQHRCLFEDDDKRLICPVRRCMVPSASALARRVAALKTAIKSLCNNIYCQKENCNELNHFAFRSRTVESFVELFIALQFLHWTSYKVPARIWVPKRSILNPLSPLTPRIHH